MPANPMDDHSQLARHLELFKELGADGVSRDPAWRRRSATLPFEAGAPAAAPEAAATVAVPPAATASAGDAMQAVRDELGDCTRCKLHRLGRRQIVFGVGNPAADLMFVGEAPGRDEDIQGYPFVGRAGQLLTKIIEAIDLTREQVYIANVIKCRPPENRNPEPDEVASCEPFLFAQIDVVKPSVIVALGSFAVRTLLETDAAISRLRGKVYDYRGARLVPTFHPAYLLRSPEKKRDTWEDMKKVRALLRDED
jgi:uracil-DNA glycosylase family 4